MDNDQNNLTNNEDLAQQAGQQMGGATKQVANQAVQPVKKAAKKAVKETGKAAAKVLKAGAKQALKLGAKAVVAFAKAIIQFLIALGPIGLAVLGAVILVAIIFNWQMDERGSSGQLSQDIAHENPSMMVDGVQTAVALTEPQALIDAYYKYLACNSHQKVYIPEDGGTPIQLTFNDPDQTSDFAGLMDLQQKENYYYLSSYFIKMADELLHNSDFYYPEQIIKPVFAQALPLETPDADHPAAKYITALPLVDDGSPNAAAIRDGTSAYAIGESTVGSDDEIVKRNANITGSKNLLAKSQEYIQQSVAITDSNGNTATGEALKPGTTGTLVDGVWDYGFGSILQYEPREKDMYINVASVSFTIHYHTYTPIYNDEGMLIGYETHCDGTTRNATVNIAPGDTVISINRYLSDVYEKSYGDGSYNAIVYQPSDTMLTELLKDWDKLEMNVQPQDTKLSMRQFEDVTLESAFGNANRLDLKHYPLKTSVISAAATFSGNIRYEYEQEDITKELSVQGLYGEDDAAFTDKWREDCTQVIYSGITASDGSGAATGNCAGENMIVSRSGTVHDIHPSTNPTEVSAPTGFQYIEDYDNHYKVYVPNTVQEDMDFQKRISKPIEGVSYDSDMDYNKDKIISNMDFLLGLGLLRPYSGGTLDSVGSGAGGGALTSDEQALVAGTVTGVGGVDADTELLARCICAEAGPNKLDQLMVGAVVLNRISDSRFPNTIIGILTAPGQYQSWRNGSIQGADTSSARFAACLSSAKQLMEGRFTIPSNVVFQKGSTATAEGTAYMAVVNGSGYNTHIYSISSYDSVITAVDRYGRTALTEAQARNLANTLYQEDVTNGVSSGTGGSGGGIGDTGVTVPSVPGNISSDYNLYAVTGFDVLTSITNMHNYQEREAAGEDTGLLGWFVNIGKSLSATIENFTDYVQSVFNAAFQVNSIDYYLMYNYNVPLSTMRDTVYQAMTFSEQSTYSDAADSTDPDALVFLFLGKNAGIGFGTNGMGGSWVPGTGSTIDGFTSPTNNFYQISSPYNESSGTVTLATPAGTIIQAVADGVITSVEESGGFYSIKMTSSAGGSIYVTTYGNLSSVTVSSGQTVSKGTKLGVSGAGGLILGLTVDGVPKDPMKYFYQSVFSTGVAFTNILNSDGTVNNTARDELKNSVNQANSSSTGLLDKWHSKPLNTKSVGECTWWAYGRGWQFCEANGTLPSRGELAGGYGNGGDYYAQASSDFATGQTPRVGSWVVWSGGAKGYGHVAFVEAVEADGSIWISESGRGYWDRHNGNGVAIRKFSPTNRYSYGAAYSFQGFVYLDQPIS